MGVGLRPTLALSPEVTAASGAAERTGAQDDARRTRSSHDNASARVLLAFLGTCNLHRRGSVFDGKEARRRVHVHHSFPFLYRVVKHGRFLRRDSCLEIPR